MKTIRTIFCLALTASIALAQSTTHSSFPQDTVSESSGTYGSLGTNSSGSGDESRFQQLIPAQYLPSTGGQLLGIHVVPNFTGAVTYASLKITIAHTSNSVLSKTFASNLQNPVTVFQGTDVTVGYTKGQWSPIGFLVPFIYDGKSNLVIEFQKIIDRAKHKPAWTGILAMQTRGNPIRRDLPLAVLAFGAFGSGTSTQPNSRFGSFYPMSLRFAWPGNPTITLKSDPSAPNGTTFTIGSTIEHKVFGAPGSLYVNLVSVGWTRSPLVNPLLTGIGYLDLSLTITMNSAIMGGGGSATLPIPVPVDPSLAALQLTFQSAIYDGSTLRWTNGADGIINP